MFLGFYDYTVILTYIGLGFSIVGMTQALDHRFKTALFCLVMSGLCDMFDGMVARSKKNRTDDEKTFGIQIDSLCDLICFGAFPIIIGYSFGVRGILGNISLVCYGLAAVIRLGYFNVTEQKRQAVSTEHRKYYEGLPVTSVAAIFPMIYLAKDFCQGAFVPMIRIAYIVIAFLFISTLKIPKPGTKACVIFVVLAALLLTKMNHLW